MAGDLPESNQARPLDRSLFGRVVAIAEIVAILVVGNLLAIPLLRLIFSPAALAQSWTAGSQNALELAGVDAVQITLRFGIMLAAGFALLWWRFRLTPRDVGLTRNNQPLGRLIAIGALLFCVAALPTKLLFLVNEFVYLGPGLPIWDDLERARITFGFVMLMLAGSVALPPLYEELLVRGYMRVRVARNFGAMGGIVITSALFALAHTQYLRPDALLILIFFCLVFAVICWAYVVHRSGSLIPAMVAHALVNMPEPHTPVVLTGGIVAMVIAIAVWRHTVMATFGDFARDWARAEGKPAILITVAILAATALTFVALR